MWKRELRDGCARANRVSSSKCIYSRLVTTAATMSAKRSRSPHRMPAQASSKQLQNMITEVEKYTQAVRNTMRATKGKRKTDEHVPSNLDADTDEAYRELMGSSGPDLFLPEQKRKLIPPRLEQRLGESLALVQKETPEWGSVVQHLMNHGGLHSLTTYESNYLLHAVPLKERAKVAPLILEMMTDAGIGLDHRTYQFVISGYAESGNVILTESFYQEMLSHNIQPNIIVVGNLFKVYNKVGDMQSTARFLQECSRRNIKLNRVIYTTILQTCIRVHDFRQSNEIFAMLKFLASEYQPDIRTYNSMIYMAGKDGQVERALDLYREMTKAATNPIEPDADTLNKMAYVCAQRPEYYPMAWHFIMQIRDRGFAVTRETMDSILFVCGRAGELNYARAIVMRMCESPESWPDQRSWQALMRAYSTLSKGNRSTLVGAVGKAVRETFVFDVLSLENRPPSMPPFLPISNLKEPASAIAESEAIFKFLLDQHPQVLNPQIIGTYISIPISHGQYDEAKRRLMTTTFFPQVSVSTKDASISIADPKVPTRSPSPPPDRPYAILRNHHIFKLGFLIAKRLRDVEFAKKLWLERGYWRKMHETRKLPKVERDAYDFDTTVQLIDIMALARKLDDAASLLRSTRAQFFWTFEHLKTFYTISKQSNYQEGIRLIKNVCKRWS